MEDQSALDFLAFLAQLEGGLQVARYEDNAGLGLSHVELSVTEPEIIGTGSAETLDLATRKAISEFTERAVYHYYKKNLGLRSSNGLAAHATADLATSAAIKELVERDAFFCCWLLSLGPLWIAPAQLPPTWSSRLEHLRTFGLAAKIGIQAKTGSILTGVGLITSTESPPQFGYAVTSAAGENIDEIVNRIWTDFGRYSGIILHRAKNSLPMSRFDKPEQIQKPADHLEYFLGRKHRCPVWFSGGLKVPTSLPVFEIQTSILFSGTFMDCPVVVAHSQSPAAQVYFSGPTRREHINLSRLQAIQTYVHLDTLNKELHPLP